MIVQNGWIFSICEIYWEYGTAVGNKNAHMYLLKSKQALILFTKNCVFTLYTDPLSNYEKDCVNQAALSIIIDLGPV